MNKKISGRRWALAAVFVIGMLAFTGMAFAEGEDAPIHYGVLSLVVPLIAIVLSFITRQVILSLATAVFVGAVILNGGNVFHGFLRMCDQYIVGTVTDTWNVTLMLFILSVGGLIAVMARMGGTQAMALAMAKKSKNAKHALVVTWIMGIIIFFEDMANSLIVGPTMRPVTDELRISREKLSYVIDSTAGPVTDMAFISSWVAYEIGMIGIALTTAGLAVENTYGIFLETVPYRFYNIFAIDVWMNGCKELLLTVTILLFAWTSGSIMHELGTGAYIAELVGGTVPGAILPVIIFAVSCLVSFSTGTSYGTTAIMIPIAFPLAMGINGGVLDSYAVLTIAAVTCGAIFGDHCSPISDTTIMSSMGSAADLMDHVRTQIPYAATAAIVAAVCGFIPAALGVPAWICLPIGIVVLYLVVRFLGKSTKEEDLKKEAAQEAAA